jgi:hypothetical protein
MDSNFDVDKIEKLRRLEKIGVVSEMCPEPGFWRFQGLSPFDLPEVFHEEYLQTGEIRWR